MKRLFAAAALAAFLLPAASQAQECLLLEVLEARAANAGAKTVMVDLQSSFGSRIDGATRALFMHTENGIILVGFEIGGCMSDPVVLGMGTKDVQL